MSAYAMTAARPAGLGALALGALTPSPAGNSSTAAMVSCCAHYLVNVAPVLGATGLVTFAAQYQVEFFSVGIAFIGRARATRNCSGFSDQ